MGKLANIFLFIFVLMLSSCSDSTNSSDNANISDNQNNSENRTRIRRCLSCLRSGQADSWYHRSEYILNTAFPALCKYHHAPFPYIEWSSGPKVVSLLSFSVLFDPLYFFFLPYPIPRVNFALIFNSISTALSLLTAYQFLTYLSKS